MRGRPARTYSVFALTDEAYALTTTDQANSWSGRRILYLQAFVHLYWVGGATTGALLGGLIPDTVTGLDFALTALFATGLLARHLLASRKASRA
ncbi:AzlC protein [Kribbella sp. VKM Ac-2527]|uniref:AzlC protein n=1 Tax=Kribbella caucasensis TaxID=2512215 RepID=A0A4V3C8Z2_9ACTN|nr:AzlC family ABC transporter permease [Kribbella sp. VKM Ac-2527]TDO43398.1 AzlC protein [Kribbella sp. VKM Ac-2527]